MACKRHFQPWQVQGPFWEHGRATSLSPPQMTEAIIWEPCPQSSNCAKLRGVQKPYQNPFVDGLQTSFRALASTGTILGAWPGHQPEPSSSETELARHPVGRIFITFITFPSVFILFHYFSLLLLSKSNEK